MCIIIGGLRKNLVRAEQLQGMKTNDSGFYVAVLRKSDRPGIEREVVSEVRTLDQDKAMAVWDSAKDDDYVVTHSRIPSCGGRTEANIHGWESDGIRFCHNGTMTNVADLMSKDDPRTDSEFFFREIFIPLWRSQGRDFNRLVTNVVNAVRGSSRLCFIMPDGSVVYFGDYEKDHECSFSNRSYKVYTGIGWGAGYDWGRFRTGTAGTSTASGLGLAGGSVGTGVVTKPPVPDGRTLTALLGGRAGVAKLAMSHVVVESLTSRLVEEASDAVGSGPGSLSVIDDFEQSVSSAFPLFVTTDTVAAVNNVEPIDTLKAFLNGSKLEPSDVANLLEQYSAEVETLYACDAEDSALEKTVRDAFGIDVKRIAATMRLCNAAFNWNAAKFKLSAVAWKMTENRRHQMKMVERDPTEVFDILRVGKRSKDDWAMLCDNLSILYSEIRKGKPAW